MIKKGLKWACKTVEQLIFENALLKILKLKVLGELWYLFCQP